MSKVLFLLSCLFLLETVFSAPSCKEKTKYCSKCDLPGTLCLKCVNEVFTPDKNGGCVGAGKCVPGVNSCLECDEKENLCKKCEQGYTPDANGGCTYTNNCDVSYKGVCLKCKEDHILVGDEFSFKICKSLLAEDYKNCRFINQTTGLCDVCEEGFNLNTGDRKCIKTGNCSDSIFGVCIECAPGFYYNKKEDKCINKDTKFFTCKETLDGETCDKCSDGYFFAEDGKCVSANFCAKSRANYYCNECLERYFLSKDGASCTPEKRCLYGDKETGICKQCPEAYYLDLIEGDCKPNRKDDEFKFCKTAKESCLECENGYYLGSDSKCSSSVACSESQNGVCIECEEYNYMGNDHKCTKTEHCIKSIYFNCIECQDGFLYNKTSQKCIKETDLYIHCKITGWDGNSCGECKDDFFLSLYDNLCYDNKKQGIYYKCMYSDDMGTKCINCIEGYYLGRKDFKCSKINHCLTSRNENYCTECDYDYCLDQSTGKCEKNFVIEDEEKKVFFRCNKTDVNATACVACEEGFTLGENGLCVDYTDCDRADEKEECKKCKPTNAYGTNLCLNEDFGCVSTSLTHCVKCDDVLDFDTCTECEEGYDLNALGYCEKP